MSKSFKIKLTMEHDVEAAALLWFLGVTVLLTSL